MDDLVDAMHIILVICWEFLKGNFLDLIILGCVIYLIISGVN